MHLLDHLFIHNCMRFVIMFRHVSNILSVNPTEQSREKHTKKTTYNTLMVQCLSFLEDSDFVCPTPVFEHFQ